MPLWSRDCFKILPFVVMTATAKLLVDLQRLSDFVYDLENYVLPTVQEMRT